MHPVLRRRLSATVWAAPLVGRSDYGDPTFGEPVPLRARVEPTTKRVTSPQGEEVTAEVLVIVEAGIGAFDRVWLPGLDPAVDAGRLPKSVFPVPGEFGGTDHVEVYL